MIKTSSILNFWPKMSQYKLITFSSGKIGKCGNLTGVKDLTNSTYAYTSDKPDKPTRQAQ